MILFTDSCVAAIELYIAAHGPERGGTLLGPANTNLISAFLYDAEARTTSATYTPSARLVEDVAALECAEDLSFKGIVHSHPGGFDRPSAQDLNSFASNLKFNPRMASFIAPIVTMVGPPAGGKRHEIALGGKAKLSCFEAFRLGPRAQTTKPVALEKCAVSVLRISEATDLLRAILQEELS